MTFISYAQNYEDVMLWRALKHVKKGCYIDVGAQDPVLDSVTKAFYDRGWRGINIEPSLQWYAKLLEQRPEDLTLQLAAGAETGELFFYEISDTGLSTLNKQNANEYNMKYGYEYTQHLVKVKTIKDICFENNVSTIHFLKIDVEGAEKDVIQGIDFSKTRPWIMVIESTTPNTQIENHHEWEYMIINNNYSYAYFDGLNRFYIAEEKNDLIKYFKTPPNIFDGFIKSEESQAHQVEQQAHQIERLSSSLHCYKDNIDRVNTELQLVYNSKSWRITKPLRGFGKKLKKTGIYIHIASNLLLSLAKRIVRKVIYLVFILVNKLPYMKNLVKALLYKIPRLESKLKRTIQLYKQASFPVGSESYAFMTDTDNLTPRARCIYADLIAAYKRQGKEISK